MADPSAGDSTGVLAIRAWSETGRFRARVRWTWDVEDGTETVVLCNSKDEVSAVVGRWLAGLAADRD
jgi:hypothetical protein